MTTLTLYGIPNCDSVRKTRQYLEQHQVSYEFSDIRDTPPSDAQLTRWLEAFGDKLVNKRSTTYRAHKDAAIDALTQGTQAIVALLQAQPTMIKRPIIEQDGVPLLLGWDEGALSNMVVRP